MRGTSERNDIQRTATIDEYIKAYQAGNFNLSARIELANSGPNLQSDWLPIDFAALREAVLGPNSQIE
jgi:hypothetical protein